MDRICFQEKIEDSNSPFSFIYPYHRQVWKASPSDTVTPVYIVELGAPKESMVC